MHKWWFPVVFRCTDDLTLLQQFAIRPTLRNHNVLTRDGIIKLVASVVGPGHEVDLKNYDLLILVEVYKVSITPSSKIRSSTEADQLTRTSAASA